MIKTTAPVQSLHDQIMRLPCTPPKDANVNQMLAYKSGHRDARHAAAELAAAYEADAQQAAPAAVPDGWKPVPVEPTQEMWAAYRNADSGGVLFHQAYRAMLSAAPTPPAQGTDEQRPAAWIAKYQGSYILDLCLPDADDDRASLDWRPLYTAPPAQQSPLYTCIGKGGRYEKVGSAKPAGIAHFEHNIGAVIVYRDIESDHLYFRLPLDFNRRMKRIDDGDTAAPEQAEQPHLVNRSVIRDVFLRNGFTIKEGHSDLKPYVYAAAEELLALDGKEVAAEQDAVTVPRELLKGAAALIETHVPYPTAVGAELRALLGGGA